MNEWWLLISLVFLLAIALVIALYPLRKPKINLMLLTPIICCLVAFAYWRWGALPDWHHYIQQQARQQQIQAMLQSVRNPQELITKLKERLVVQPDSARGWYLLGRIYASQGDWQHAHDAYVKANQLKPHDEQITVNYAQSLWQLNNQAFDPHIRSLFKWVLSKNKNQPDALAMLAMDAFVGHAYQQAIDYWQRLLKIAPPQSEDAQAIRKAIVKAQQKTQPGVKHV